MLAADRPTPFAIVTEDGLAASDDIAHISIHAILRRMGGALTLPGCRESIDDHGILL
jgi:hypothetical protein